MSNQLTFDLVIIGAGPAGLSAAIQAKRLGLNLVVLERDRPGGQALAAYSIENYPGFAFGIPGKQLMERFIEQATASGIDFQKREAKSVERTKDGFRTTTESDNLISKAVVVACGLKPKRLNIMGSDEMEGKKLFYYVDPSWIEHRGKRVLVIGGGDAAFDQALGFAERASEVIIAMKGASPRCLFLLTRRAERRNIKIVRSATPYAMQSSGDAVKVAFVPTGSAGDKGAWNIEVDVVIACLGKSVDLDILRPMMRGDGRFPIKPGPVKKWPGLYLAGDVCRGNQRQISIAAGDGMHAAMDIYSYLIEQSDDENPFTHR